MLRFTKTTTFLIPALCLMVFIGCNSNRSPNQRVEHDEYDGPALAARMEYERTKDPATGKVPRQLLLNAIAETNLSKDQLLNKPESINALTWVERGPNSDVPGPAGNSRANNGITSGRIRAVMIDSNDATHKTVFVGGVDGGLWKTTNITVDPANWTLINDNLSNLAVSAICQDPRPGFTNNMYFCTGESYYNFDAVEGNGVFKSTDGGITWNFLGSTSSYLNCTRILCDYLGNVYLATRGNGILRSINGGTSWTNISPTGFLDFCDMDISSTSVAGRLHVVAGIFSTQAYFFTDIPLTVAPATWTSPVVPFPSFANRAEIAVGGSTVYALPADGSDEVPTIYKSTNGGLNWAAATAPSAGWASQQGWYALAACVNPADPAQCIIGGLDTWKTVNTAGSWTQLSTWVGTSPVNQYVHADVHKILWYDGGTKVIFASDGGIFYSGDGGTTIRDRNTGLRIKQFFSVAIHPTTTNYFLAGAQDNGVHQFNNAGLSSTIEVTGGDGGFVAIDQDQPLFQFGSYVHNVYRRSVDGGTTWSTVSLNANSGEFINPFDYDNTANIMYCSEGASSYRRWTNPQSGSSSAVVTVSNMVGNPLSVCVSPYTANRVYFGTNSGKVVQVDNANTFVSGSAATDRSTGLPVGTISCVNVGTNDQNLIAVYSNYNVSNVWISTNGGASWTAVEGNLPNMPVNWAMFYPGDNSKAYIATETGVWETSLFNGASTVWSANGTFPNVRTDMLKYRSVDHTIAAATHGRGLWTAILPIVTTPDLQFENLTSSSSEATAFTSGCRGYTDYIINMNILGAPTGAAVVTLAVAGGGSAIQNIDYAITTNGNFAAPSMLLNFANGSTTSQPFTIRIYDDAAVEANESFTLTYSISGTTNAQAGSSNQTFTYTINDNDIIPVASSISSGTIGTSNISFNQPFRGSFFDSRTQIIYTAAELTAQGFSSGIITSIGLNVTSKSSTQPYNGFTIKLKNTSTSTLGTSFETGGTQVYFANYSTVAGLNTFLISPFLWDGTSNLLVDICWDNSTGTADDNVAGFTSSANTFYNRENTNATPGCSMSNAAFVFGTSARPVITFAMSVVSAALSSSKSAYLGPNDDVYFYDASGNILARIKNLTAFDYGCTQVIIDRAGSTSTQFWNNTSANYLASKSIKVIPTNVTTTGSYQITLYYTGGEITGWQTATGQVLSSAQVVKISNGFFVPDVTPGLPHLDDVMIAPGTASTYGTGNKITASYSSTGFSGFGLGFPCAPTSGVILWTGAVSTTWANAGNWSCGAIPTATSDVQINAGLANYPVVNSNVSVKSLLLRPGSTVTVNTGFNLTVK